MGDTSYVDKVALSLWVIFVQKNEHISKFPTVFELITDKLVFWRKTGFSARFIACLYTVTKTNCFFFKRQIKLSELRVGKAGKQRLFVETAKHCCEPT